MEQEDLIYLDDGAQEAYMAFQRKFESEDWQMTVKWAAEQAEHIQHRELSAKSWDQVMFCRGGRASYNEIVNLETAIENQFLELVAAAKARRIAADEGDNE